jgi:putative transposase
MRRTSRRTHGSVGEQLPLGYRMHGGPRKGAGRKPSPDREGFMPHAARPDHDFRNPVHVTMRAVRACPSLRTQRALRAVHQQLARLLRRDGTFRVNHFSLQETHLHMIVESDDRVALWRGVQWLAARIARAVNKIYGRSGSLWRDRYHRHDLTTPREVKNCLVYVLFNVRKHGLLPWITPTARGAPAFDLCSSSAWFEGFDERAGPYVADVRELLAKHDLLSPPVSRPETWLGTRGWLDEYGPIHPTDFPRQPHARR